MVSLFKRRSKKIGLSPGQMVFTGEKKIDKPRIWLIDYDMEDLSEKEVGSIEECFPFKETPTVTWVNIDGLHDISILEKISKNFEIHPLVMEDILSTDQRPKMEDYEKYIYIVIKLIDIDTESAELKAEQLSIVLGPNFVLTFQERVGDVFGPLRERIRSNKGRIRKLKSDYLAYSIIDAVIDNYFIVLEKIAERIENIEDEVLSNPTPQTLSAIHDLKRELIFLRKAVWPLREAVGNLERGTSELIHDSTDPFLRDAYDHAIRVMDTTESLREMVSGLMDIYLSSVSNKMNEVMKVLTIIATIFIPITFVAGIYGMNFESMPELKWPWAYGAVWIIIVAVAALMLFFFRRKKWL